jgi:ketosteroid isomerase-like protein
MKKVALFILLSAVSVVVWSCVQAPTPAEQKTYPPAISASTEDTVAVITQLEKDWVAAIVNKEVAVLERVLAADFRGTSPGADTYFKADAINDLTSGDYAVKSMDLDEINVTVYGDTAVSFTSQAETSKYLGKDTSGHYHFTDVWFRKDGRWQVVASHGSRFGGLHTVTP